jgi:effector-binding domain-containing protein
MAASKSVLERAREHFRKDTTMTGITTTLAPDGPVLTVLRRLTVDAIDGVIASSIRELREVARGARLTETGDPFGVFHNPVDLENDGPLEICLPVSDLTPTSGEVRSYRFGGGQLANRDVSGDETDWPAVLGHYDEVFSWIEHNGYTQVGPPRETWHSMPGGDVPLAMTISWPFA